MKTYRVYVHPEKTAPVVVKAGFCWPAFLIGPLWFLVNGMWVNFVLVAMFVAATHLYSVRSGSGAMLGLLGFVYLITWWLIGLLANPLLAAELVSKGYVLRGTVKARSMLKASELAREQRDVSGETQTGEIGLQRERPEGGEPAGSH